MQLIIDTYENEDATPILTHTFYGKTAADIQAVVNAHKKTDTFFKAAMTSGRFGSIKLTNKLRWVK